MPFDALMLRSLETLWQRTLIGARLERAVMQPGIVWLMGRQRGQRLTLMASLSPGLAQIHRVDTPPPKDAVPVTWSQRLFPAEIVKITVPPFERIVVFDLATRDVWDQPQLFQLVVELAGHLTNVIGLNQDQVVMDAIRRVPVGSKGRVVWPGVPYTPPPLVANPCQTRRISDLPPSARQLLMRQGPDFWDQLCRDWSTGYNPWYLTTSPTGKRELWVYPRLEEGWDNRLVEDPEPILESLFTARQSAQQLDQLRKQVQSRLHRREEHLMQKVTRFSEAMGEDGEHWREKGDLWLAYQYLFANKALPTEVTVESFSHSAQNVTLTLAEGETPAGNAQSSYKRYKKIKNRQAAAQDLLPQIQKQLDQVKATLRESEQVDDPQWFHKHLADSFPAKDVVEGPRQFHRFTSTGGFPVWVGRNRDENHILTFKKSRPDDIWLHVKSSPGSHVLLMCGRTNPSLEDLLDAANLAVFYSSASASSQVPVDYTRRKFVRKRPHAEPGQVLYQREKTLYITPNADRLKRLGAISERLFERDD